MESISVSTRGGAQRLAHGLEHESPTLLDRLSKLSAASLRINGSLDFDTVLQGVIDTARSLTNARYGALIAFDQSGGIENLITSGITPEERPRFGPYAASVRLHYPFADRLATRTLRNYLKTPNPVILSLDWRE